MYFLLWDQKPLPCLYGMGSCSLPTFKSLFFFPNDVVKSWEQATCQAETLSRGWVAAGCPDSPPIHAPNGRVSGTRSWPPPLAAHPVIHRRLRKPG